MTCLLTRPESRIGILDWISVTPMGRHVLVTDAGNSRPEKARAVRRGR
jgi:hypothetical protein